MADKNFVDLIRNETEKLLKKNQEYLQCSSVYYSIENLSSKLINLSNAHEYKLYGKLPRCVNSYEDLTNVIKDLKMEKEYWMKKSKSTLFKGSKKEAEKIAQNIEYVLDAASSLQNAFEDYNKQTGVSWTNVTVRMEEIEKNAVKEVVKNNLESPFIEEEIIAFLALKSDYVSKHMGKTKYADMALDLLKENVQSLSNEEKIEIFKNEIKKVKESFDEMEIGG